jgi:SAM-dependent methyltransferase
MSFFDVGVRWKDKAVRSLRKRGVFATGELALRVIKENLNLSERWQVYQNESFDKRFGVDTAAGLAWAELQSDPRFKYRTVYGATRRSVFFRALHQLKVEHSDLLFIDFGCGKGKALLLASDLHFKQIIGIELSSKLIRIAEENLKTYRGGTLQKDVFQLLCMDVSEYPIPLAPAIYYFANPFPAEVMVRVLENLRSSLAAAPRESYIVYLEPELRALLDESGFLTTIKRTSLYSIWKVAGVPRQDSS